MKSLILPNDNLTNDVVLPFQLEASALRGRMVKLGTALDMILAQHAYPEPVAHLLAEATAIAVALAASLKYEGVFTLQAKGDGVVRMLVADVSHDGGIRAYAQFDEAKLDGKAASIGLLGKGHLAFTCTLIGTDERYQGIVALDGESLAEAVQHYFRQSEQIPTGIAAAAGRDSAGHWRAGCLLVQKMPRDGGVNVENATPEAEDWTRAMMLLETCSPGELIDPALPAPDLVVRLFHEEGVRGYDTQALRHQCRCTPMRVENMLRSLPRDEIEELAVGGVVTVTCEFCNKSYAYDVAAREKLWNAPSAQE